MLANWVKETTTTSGTSTITLAGAVTGFTSFNKQFGDATTNTPPRFFKYVISDGNNWETGTGYLPTTATLARSLVEATYSGTTYTRYGAPLSLSGGSATVFCDLTDESEDMPYVLNGTSTSGGVPAIMVGAPTATCNPMINGSLCFTPFYMAFPGIYSGISYHISALNSATKAKIAIYGIAPTGYPGYVLAQTAEVTTGGSTLGTGNRNTSFTANLFMRKGWYMLSIQSDNRMDFNCSSQYSAGGSGNPLGVDSNGEWISLCYLSQAYGSFPDNPVPTNFIAADQSYVCPWISFTRTA